MTPVLALYASISDLGFTILDCGGDYTVRVCVAPELSG